MGYPPPEAATKQPADGWDCWLLSSERSGTNALYNTLGDARHTKVKFCYRLVLYGSCMALDVQLQFTGRRGYIDLRDPHFRKML